MQLASSGKGLGHFASAVRSLHVHAHPHPHGLGAAGGAAHRPPPSSSSSSTTTAGRLLKTTRTALTRFFVHLSTPGFSHSVVAGGRNGAAGLLTRVNAAVRPETIQARLSLPARQACDSFGGRPTMFMPRASPVRRSTVQVGLGTARNFSTARPLFESFVQNVPVAARTVCEVDWEVERRRMKGKVRRAVEKEEKEKEDVATFEISGLRAKPVEKINVGKEADELEKYFPVETPAASDVTTVLLVPMAPTPTSRLPLMETHSAEPSLIVISDLQDILSSHRKHSLRVSSLFARLDACGVWEKGATFAAHGDATGLCTVLHVELKGWTAARVREVIGEAGKGWCRLVEIHDGEDEDDMNSPRSSASPSLSSPDFDPAASVVLPMLDFSASFHGACASVVSGPPSPPMSDMSSPLHSLSTLSYSPSMSISDMEVEMEMESDFLVEGDDGGDTASMISFSTVHSD